MDPICGVTDLVSSAFESQDAITAGDSRAAHDHSIVSEASEQGFSPPEIEMIYRDNAGGEGDPEQQLGESEEEVRAERERAVERLHRLAAIIVPMTIAFIFTVLVVLKGHNKDLRAAVQGKAFAFYIFLVGDVVAFFASTIVLVILAIMPSIRTNNLVFFSKAVLCISVGLFALSFLAAAYMVMPTEEKWFVISVGLGTVAVIGFAFVHIVSLS